MSSAPTPQEIWKDARWLVQAVDPRAGLVRVVEMSEDDYRQASFLDDRMFAEQHASHLLKWYDVVAAAPSDARSDARWIFHIGHVGSTLIARLLGELDGVLSIREPRALRDLSFFPADIRGRFVPAVRELMSRTFSGHQAAVVKATSFVSEMAPELTEGTAKALYLFATPPAYISGILAGENSRKELSGSAEMRRQRLAARGLELPPPRNEADAAAFAWTCEMTTLEAADGPACLWADFDGLLCNLQLSLGKITHHFELTASDQTLAAIATSPLTQRYSKATEFEYSLQLRRDLLADAHARHLSDIESALAMLNAAAETAPLLRKALDRAQAES
jgi:hypothetical protein